MNSMDWSHTFQSGKGEVTAQGFRELSLVAEEGAKSSRDGQAGPKPAILFLPVTTLRSHQDFPILAPEMAQGP